MGSEFLRMKRILDQIHETEDETKKIAEVSRIKAVLDQIGNKSEFVLCYLLKKLKQMVVSLKVLVTTMIGTSVSVLQEHASEDIRGIVRMLILSWGRMVDEWVIEDDRNNMCVSHEKECEIGSNINIEKQVMQPTSRNGNGNYTCFGSVETTRKSGDGMNLEKKIEEKLEAAKRKVREGYIKAENAKKQRKIQVIEMDEVLSLKLVSEKKATRFRNHKKSPYVRLVQ